QPDAAGRLRRHQRQVSGGRPRPAVPEEKRPMPSPVFFPPRADRRPLDFVLTDFPFPVAVAYARLQGEVDRQEPVAAAWQLLDAFQSLLKFAAALGVPDFL